MGVYTVWLGHVQRGLPGECRSIALLDRDVARLKFIEVGAAKQIADVAADAVEPDLALEVARALASLRDIGALGAANRSAALTGPGMAPGTHTHRETGGEIAVSPFTWAHIESDLMGDPWPLHHRS